jgi:hypothetical protein
MGKVAITSLIWLGLIAGTAVLTWKLDSTKVFRQEGMSEIQAEVCRGLTSRARYLACLNIVRDWEEGK